MTDNLAGIETGMDVVDVNGDKVGTVADILAVQAYSQTGASAAYGTGSPSDVSASGYDAGVAGEGSLLKVHHGGVLGIGATELFIPFDAVSNVVPGKAVTVNCTKDNCTELYSRKPEFLKDNA